MFTGIVEEVGKVEAVTSGEKSAKLRIRACRVLEDAKLGDSICTSGVCLTVTKLQNEYFEADVMAETMRRSKLGTLKPGDHVNLERALKLSARLGGHIVSGHIDGVGTLKSAIREENAVWLTIAADPFLLRYIVDKGSIAVDGISLTVAGVDKIKFRVSIIPHTGMQTTLLSLKTGDKVNLECDIISKYVEKLFLTDKFCGSTMQNLQEKPEGMTESFLKTNGFY